MNYKQDTQVAQPGKKGWVWYALILLTAEKIIQHIFVTLAFFFDWGGIGATVAISPTILMILGAMVAVLFMVSLWAMITGKWWALNLVIGLAIFDLVGEFLAQGTILISCNVSFTVALVLLIFAFLFRARAYITLKE
jgi:hypothetical protein